MTEKTGANTLVKDIDWEKLNFTEKAVIVYIKTGSNIILIEKKTGLGAGKINAPGGRIEKNETPAEAAVRECREEIGVTPLNLKPAAELSFVFTSSYTLFGYVYTAEGYEGTLTETEEANPFLCRQDMLPYDKMWEDDILWLPEALAGKFIAGRFIFDNDKMLDYHVMCTQKQTISFSE